MAIQVNGTQVIGNSRELTNIASVDATTAASITSAGVGGATSLNGLSDCTVSTTDPLFTTNPPSGVGTVWINTTSGEQYICTDATTNDNVWRNVGDGTGPIVSFESSGGTKTTSGIYTIHTFTSSGTFTIGGSSIAVETLVIAGGGAGGWDDGAGGGAGGYISSVSGESSGGGTSAVSGVTLTPNSYTVVVGAGGVADNTVGPGLAQNGSNSVFNTFTAIGGGYGASAGNGTVTGTRNGYDGGSGGGAWPGDNYGAGTTGQGFRGAFGNTTTSRTGGGGGGAGGAGVDGSSGVGGGIGVNSSITGTSVGRGGGGSGGTRTTSAGSVGYGGGNGADSTGTLAGAGTANTGGGGGGGSGAVGGDPNKGANGGSGVVIIRFVTP